MASTAWPGVSEGPEKYQKHYQPTDLNLQADYLTVIISYPPVLKNQPLATDELCKKCAESHENIHVLPWRNILLIVINSKPYIEILSEKR